MRRAIEIRLAHGRTGLPRTLEPSRCSGAIEATKLPRDRVLAPLARTFEISTRHRMLERYTEGAAHVRTAGVKAPSGIAAEPALTCRLFFRGDASPLYPSPSKCCAIASRISTVSTARTIATVNGRMRRQRRRHSIRVQGFIVVPHNPRARAPSVFSVS